MKKLTQGYHQSSAKLIYRDFRIPSQEHEFKSSAVKLRAPNDIDNVQMCIYVQFLDVVACKGTDSC
jgi:hypothetical protein